jgi:hypothetical protein
MYAGVYACTLRECVLCAGLHAWTLWVYVQAACLCTLSVYAGVHACTLCQAECAYILVSVRIIKRHHHHHLMQVCDSEYMCRLHACVLWALRHPRDAGVHACTLRVCVRDYMYRLHACVLWVWVPALTISVCMRACMQAYHVQGMKERGRCTSHAREKHMYKASCTRHARER